MPDHFSDQLAPTVGLAAAAAATTTLRVGALVFDNDFRNPVLVAKEMASLDVLSGGRVQVGVGAGWKVPDYSAIGLRYDSPGVRIDRLEESVTVLKLLLSGQICNFEGKHYSVHHELNPKAVQRPHPPIAIGGSGPRMLRLAAREADIVGIHFSLAGGYMSRTMLDDLKLSAFHRKIAIVNGGAATAARQPELMLQIQFLLITDNRKAAAQDVGDRMGFTPAEALATPYALVGTVESIIDDLVERRERFGLSYYVVHAEHTERFAPVVTALAGK